MTYNYSLNRRGDSGLSAQWNPYHTLGSKLGFSQGHPFIKRGGREPVESRADFLPDDADFGTENDDFTLSLLDRFLVATNWKDYKLRRKQNPSGRDKKLGLKINEISIIKNIKLKKEVNIKKTQYLYFLISLLFSQRFYFNS